MPFMPVHLYKGFVVGKQIKPEKGSIIFLIRIFDSLVLLFVGPIIQNQAFSFTNISVL